MNPSFPARPARVLALLPLASLTLVACSSSPPASESAEEVGQALGASDVRTCPATSYGFVGFAYGGAMTCPDVQGIFGRWAAHGGRPPKACTPTTAPPDSDPFVCTYDWIPDATSPNAAPDVGALEAIPNSIIAEIPSESGNQACGDPMLPWPAMLDLAGVRCPPGSGGPNGAKGCDICGEGTGMVFQDRLYMAASTPLKTVAVSVSNGSKQVLTFDPNAGPGHRWGGFERVTLPPPPPNEHYVDGPALGYGYDPAASSQP